MSTCVVAYEVLFLQTAGLGPRVLGLELFVGPTQVLNGDLRVPHLDQLQYRIVNEYVLFFEISCLLPFALSCFALFTYIYYIYVNKAKQDKANGSRQLISKKKAELP